MSQRTDPDYRIRVYNGPDGDAYVVRDEWYDGRCLGSEVLQPDGYWSAQQPEGGSWPQPTVPPPSKPAFKAPQWVQVPLNPLNTTTTPGTYTVTTPGTYTVTTPVSMTMNSSVLERFHQEYPKAS